MPVLLAETDADILECLPVMAQLRPHFQITAPDFVSAVRRQFSEGYQLAFIRHEQKVAAVAGFRVQNSLAHGRFCYVDDLVTDDHCRSHGLGGELFDWLCDYARSEKCARIELDSGVQRHGAHRFYLRRRMVISCHHFSFELK